MDDGAGTAEGDSVEDKSQSTQLSVQRLALAPQSQAELIDDF